MTIENSGDVEVNINNLSVDCTDKANIDYKYTKGAENELK